MATSKLFRDRVKRLKESYERLRKGKDALLDMIDEVELSESVYNSNAIENSTLTLKETEKILLEMELSRNVSLREVFEAKNLARVAQYIRGKAKTIELSMEMILLLHQMLLTNIDEGIAGRFRQSGEYVRVGTYIASAPEHVERLIEEALMQYASAQEAYFTDAIAKFHVDFEHTHPFNDGNGRIGRVIINIQLQRLGFPPIIIRNKEKQAYYRAFQDYDRKKDTHRMERTIVLALLESLHKRLAYLAGKKSVPLSIYAKQQKKSLSTLINAAHRQTIPAFREKGIWKIAEEA